MIIYFKPCSMCTSHIRIIGNLGFRKKSIGTVGVSLHKQLDQAYVPHKVEENHLNNKYFAPETDSTEPPFSLILPPPNVTGTLHLGHALTATIQDVLVRWHKMKGARTMWIPGLDHAGIATQVVVEKKIWQEKQKTRIELGREEFGKEVWKWKTEKESIIVEQLKKLNVMLNWENQVFTMDETRMKAVTQAFIKLFDQGLIYRGDHLVNWSCVLQSAISDIEVDHLTIEGATNLDVPGYNHPVKFGVLTKFAYKIKDSKDELIVATTRPETILGDVAVAVNPKDSRYLKFIGKHLVHPFRNDVIPVIMDEIADPNFGTGAVKITPAHDPLDFEVGKHHKLDTLQVIDEKGKLTSLCPEFEGLPRFEARSAVLNRLDQLQLLRGSEEHKMVIPICSRSKDVVEFLVRPQWFLKCEEMAQKAVQDVREKRLRIEPQNFEKVWFNWLENSRDWCISRQLWWGHRIPIYSCSHENNSEKSIFVAAENSDIARMKASNSLNCQESSVVCEQDEDVLDTWFSSGLQPFSVFGWPEETEDLQQYFPLSLMETGHDILFFWVARMVMLGTQLTGMLPFSRILLHGIICDSQGRKMSKSLGNVIAPEDVIEGRELKSLNESLENNFKSGIISNEELLRASAEQTKMFPQGIPECGADALRFTLLSHNIKNHVINFDVNECHTNKLFCNKIWQATKFSIMWCQKVGEVQEQMFIEKSTDFENVALIDKWILSRLSCMVKNVHGGLENSDFHIATAAIKKFLYYEFCDIYLDSPQDNAIEMPSIKEEEVEDIEIVEHEIPVNNNSKGIGSLPGSESLPAHAIQMIEQNNIFTKILQQARNASNQNLSSNKRPASTKEDTKIDESRKPQKIAKVCTCNGEDEFDLFGKTIAIQLKRMPLDRALMCQQSLMEIIGKERLLQMGLNRK